VYALEREKIINGQSHLQVIYRWWYLAESRPDMKSLGVCVTLDGEGHPVIWEVLDERSAVRVFFVAESLEKAAALRFGEALPGRRHAVEPALDSQPNLVVARVLDDGPVPMGPMVYVRAGSLAVSTVACRCMPAQIKSLADTLEYELLSLDLVGMGVDEPAQQDLESILRLPERF
jgi:hypothetical protein